jgi:hypothetical protein
MTDPAKLKPRGLAALARSYAADLRGWVVRLATGYGIAAALLLGGVLALFGAIAVGAVALFHVLALRYGTEIAFAALGGGLVLLAIILLLAGWLMIRSQAAAPPRPHRQFRAAKQMLVGSTVARAVTAVHATEGGKPDMTTQILLGAAAIVAAGWIAASHFGPNARRRVRR